MRHVPPPSIDVEVDDELSAKETAADRSNCFLAALAGLAPLVFARTTDRIFGFPAHVIPLAFLGLLRQEKTE